MKTSIHSPRQLIFRMKPQAHIVAMAIAIYSGNILAQTVSFPSVPLTVATAVPANLLYIHDDSNSMYWSFMPDEIHRYSMSTPKKSAVPYQLYMSSEFNKTYYDPVFKYAPPPAPPGVSVYDADGRLVTDGTLGNAKYTNAWFNGYDLATRNQSGNYVSDGTGTITRRFNLATNYTPTDHWSVIFNNSAYNGKIKGKVSEDVFTEFLPDAPTGQASYYVCPSNAWKNYPTPTTISTNYSANLCTQRFLTTDEEKQNFANWYSYYRTRNYASMAGIGRAFEKLDPSVRVGWGLINKKNSVTIDGKSVNTVIQGVRTFDQTRKKQFLEWLYKIQPAAMNRSPVFISSLSSAEKDAGGTPLRRALDNAGRYFDRRDTPNALGPWANNPASPGTAATEKAAACRKSFTILMTDGYWNSDGAATTGIVNVNVDAKSGRSPFQDSYSNTLADIAWYYWDKKLVPDTIANKVPKTPAPEALGAVPPRYRDSAEYPHMTTFTIGLGVAGNIDKDRAFKAIHDSSVGTITWPNPVNDNNTVEKIDDLLHTGVNGHGDFFSATNPDEFVRGMSSIINSVNSAQKASSGNLDASTSQVTSISGDVYLYKTHFKPDDWSGELIAQKIDSKAGLEEEVWFASEQMPAPAERKIYTRNNSNGVPFLWANLNSMLQNALRGLDQSLNGQNVLEYIRGSNANEGPNPGQFRPRYRAAPGRAPLGASPHNSPVFVKYEEKQTIFLGANDGMLHAFDASTGEEQFAYIPSALIPKLAELTNGYNAYVDGDVLVTTPTQTPDQYLLVGALGRGAKGLYGLDVSNPANFQPGHVVWEVSSPQTCPDPDPVSAYLGNVISSLAYAEIDGKPSTIFGNGYNSCHDKAALGIVDVKTGSATFIKASDEISNGLTPPHIWEDTSTHKVSAYAGDLRGKMWKFALAPDLGATPAKLFDAGTNQPITARPTVATLNTAPDVKKTYFYFGTGRYLSITDRSTTTQQSLYGLIDENGATLLLSNLVQRTFNTTTQVSGIPVKAITPLAGNVNIVKGWYLQLAEKGERVVSASSVIQTPNGDVALFTTIIPPVDGDPCDPRGSGWLYAVNAQTGGALDFAFLDLNGDGEFDNKDTINGTPPAAIKIGDLLGGMPGQAKMVNGLLVTCGLDSANCVALGTSLKKGPAESEGAAQGRISWREIVN